ncbi:MAG: hypothetical protein GYA41_02975 [Bacteroidales bacterium]|nr:hypothetical protein [Bacteroidales bacterium]
MKRRIISSFILAALFTVCLSGQNPNRERLNAYKIAFFTKRLNLTPGEAEKFWPIYNQFQDEKNKIQLERIEINRNFNTNELNLPEKEISEMGDRFIDLEVREAALARDFHNKIKQILSPVKILRLYQSENLYKQQLLKELQERRVERRDFK